MIVTISKDLSSPKLSAFPKAKRASGRRSFATLSISGEVSTPTAPGAVEKPTPAAHVEDGGVFRERLLYDLPHIEAAVRELVDHCGGQRSECGMEPPFCTDVAPIVDTRIVPVRVLRRTFHAWQC